MCIHSDTHVSIPVGTHIFIELVYKSNSLYIRLWSLFHLDRMQTRITQQQQQHICSVSLYQFSDVSSAVLALHSLRDSTQWRIWISKEQRLYQLFLRHMLHNQSTSVTRSKIRKVLFFSPVFLSLSLHFVLVSLFFCSWQSLWTWSHAKRLIKYFIIDFRLHYVTLT